MSVLAEMLPLLVGMLLITVIAEIKNCKPGTQVLAPDGCNTCSCSAKGRLGPCTLRLCNKNVHSLIKRHVSVRRKRECSPGVTFIPDGECNYCICSSKGQNTHTCTRKFCNLVRSVKDEPCKSRGKFRSQDGCNRCKCENKYAMCTMKNCGK